MFPGRSIPEMLKRRCWLLLDYISFFWLKNHIFLAANQTFAGGFQFYCWSYYDIILKSMKFVAFTNSKKGGKKKNHMNLNPVNSHNNFPSNHNKFPSNHKKSQVKSHQITTNSVGIPKIPIKFP